MNDFVCKNRLYHDKICINGEPSSNNGWIYTAYAKLLGHITLDNYNALYEACKVDSGDFIANRLPNKPEPPISRDEAIGMAILETDVIKELIETNFNMHTLDLHFISYWDSFLALVSIKDEHRNYVWQNKVIEGYKLAFKIMPHDKYFFKKKYGLKTSILEFMLFNLYAFSTLVQRDISAKNVLWGQLKSLKSDFWIGFINQPKNFLKYFGRDHVFVKGKI